ncbi:ABC transporter permease subunit [Pseudomonas sp. L-22-4S-12]|uniref:ABC transporter permease n=1 Tax=Pseudomonas sp. L-22-4S-12 TaxID=2610893 RepID=UPI00132A0483|nr:ABC transporter permease [Pseudomonas sp. L-22-4S-12]MWV15821.1 ABC transporter permease subunit [Pseudomonas sp. L-22-4S-12]
MSVLHADRRLSAWLLLPALGWLVLFLLLPCLLVLVYSFLERGAYGGIDYVFTWDNYHRALDPLYLEILLRSAKIAGLATLYAVLIGYPAAYAIARAPRQRQAVYLFLVMLPFWSNYLIRTYAWIVLLNRKGLIAGLLEPMGLYGDLLNILYTESAVILGLVYNYIPFVILAIFASLSRINGELWEASSDLGASGWTTFRRIILPLSVPGVAAGAVFVFVLSIGNFITADLLGGKQVLMVGNLIYAQFLTARDWPFGSALSFFLIAIMLLLLFIQAMLARRAQGARHA